MARLTRIAWLSLLVLLSFHPVVLAVAERLLAPLSIGLMIVVFTYLVRPPVLAAQQWLVRHTRLRPVVALSLAFSGTLLLAATSVAALVPGLMAETGALADRLPPALVEVGNYYQNELPDSIRNIVSQAMDNAGAWTQSALSQTVASLKAVSNAFALLVEALLLVPMMTWFVLRDGRDLLQVGLDHVAVAHRALLAAILADLHGTLEKFIRGKLIVCGVIGLLTGVALWPTLPEYCVVLGLVAGVAELVPIFGPLLAGVPAVVLALVSHGWATALIVLCCYLVIQQLESAILMPRIMSATLELHPLSVLAGMLVFGSVLGVWGVLLAAPLVGTVRVLVRHLSPGRAVVGGASVDQIR